MILGEYAFSLFLPIGGYVYFNQPVMAHWVVQSCRNVVFHGVHQQTLRSMIGMSLLCILSNQIRSTVKLDTAIFRVSLDTIPEPNMIGDSSTWSQHSGRDQR
jgi:hypothetical protein